MTRDRQPFVKTTWEMPMRSGSAAAVQVDNLWCGVPKLGHSSTALYAGETEYAAELDDVSVRYAPLAACRTVSSSASNSRPTSVIRSSPNCPKSEDGRSYSKIAFPDSSSKSTTRKGA